MDKILIVANWKSNKTAREALEFMGEFGGIFEAREDVGVIICPSYLSVPAVSEYVKSNNMQVEIGVQNVSELEEGAYTGEVAASQASELVKHAIIGHSERRKLFGETDERVAKKVQMAAKNGLEPIVCVISENIPIPTEVKIVAYEPVEAIGTGNPDTPENAEKVSKLIKEKNPRITHVIYGGSVTAENVSGFTKMPNVSGVLVGGASLDPRVFASIIKAC